MAEAEEEARALIFGRRSCLRLWRLSWRPSVWEGLVT